VHFGVVLIAVALAASAAHGASATVRLRVGQSATVSGYKFTYVGATTSRSGQKTTVSAGVRVQKGGRDLGVYAPAVSTYPNSTEGIGTPSVRTGLREDVYLTLVSSPNQQGRVTLGVRINSMIVWLWIGGAVMAIGTVLALLPSLRRRPRPVADERSEPDAEPDAALEEVTA
jgi:cytochrome c-type biogenesis protein CcmF